MIYLQLKNKQQEIITGSIDHDKEPSLFSVSGKEMVVLGIKEYLYKEGDFIEILSEEKNIYLYVQLEETLAPSIIFMPNGRWTFSPLLTEDRRKASIDTSFLSHRHCLIVRKALDHEIHNYQNLSFNPYDQKEFTGAYPHSLANVETRNEVVFFAKNAIDGKLANLSHGSYPFTSWGINQQSDAQLTIDFGREVQIDWVRLLFRGDYPHDSHWIQVTLSFSDGEDLIFETTNSLLFQDLKFPKKITSTLTLKNLIKADDESPFPALTQIEIYGKNQ